MKFRERSVIDNLLIVIHLMLIQLLVMAIASVTPKQRPNVVFILTDDQDIELGSLMFMQKTLRLLRSEGAMFNHAYVTTPMCCPSRSSILTGMYVHNHNTYTNNDNCSSPSWRETYETRNFGTYLSSAGYRTGYFGKYLNGYKGNYIPPGWTEWMGLIRNTRFYNYTVNYNGRFIKHFDDYSRDYFTDVITNRSVEFLLQSKKFYPRRPVAMVLSMPAPHGPEDSAPQYQNMFFDVKTHRTPSWNIAPNPDKQWILQRTSKMSSIQINFTDILHTKRLQTLLSVDDAVAKVYETLEGLGELENTYFIYTSDHGYHLGQYGLTKGKAMPYEFDTKVPFLMRGPKIPRGIKIDNIVLNLDIAPTLLDIAGISIPEHMDGTSILRLFDDITKPKHVVDGLLKKKKAWRDTFLIERGKLNDKKLKVQPRLEAEINNFVAAKDKRLEEECSKPEYRPPCKDGQFWECRRNRHGKLRIFKCRTPTNSSRCNCMKRKISDEELQRQMEFLKNHVNQPEMVEARFVKVNNRPTRPSDAEVTTKSQAFDQLSSADGSDVNDNNNTDLVTLNSTKQLCRLLSTGEVYCDAAIYTSPDAWRNEKQLLDLRIQNFRHKINELKMLRQHLVNIRYPGNVTSAVIGSTQDDLHHDEDDIAGSDEESDCTCDDEMNDDPLAVHLWNDKVRGRRRQNSRFTGGGLRKSRQLKSIGHPRRHSLYRNAAHFSDSLSVDSNQKQYGYRNDPMCNVDGLECNRMDNEHWKIPPLWTLGTFCFCPNSNNNTYWCLRTINDSHNFLYCEFITGFVSFYDILKDPYQLRNAVHDLSYTTLHQLHEMLENLKECKGTKKCNHRYRPKQIKNNEADINESSDSSVFL